MAAEDAAAPAVAVDDNEAEEPERRRIQDLETWLNGNGLSEDDRINGQYNSESNREREVARLQEHDRYQEAVHAECFREALQQEEEQKEEQVALLNTLDGLLIDLSTADGDRIQNVDAKKLAKSCDMIVRMASSRHRFATPNNNNNNNNNDDNNNKLHISLEEYPKSSVEEFLDVVVFESKDAESISSEAIVDCCRISHYLLCQQLLEKITDMLLASIDTSNCLSICQLADALGLPLLFERALGHLMGSIGELENDDAVWDHLTPELRDRIATIKTAIESSIHDSRSRLFFSSLDEYVAIFAERVEYYKERLAEAKEQQEEAHSGTNAWYDAQHKINKQERRVRTLEIALAEQKKLFQSKNHMRVQW